MIDQFFTFFFKDLNFLCSERHLAMRKVKHLTSFVLLLTVRWLYRLWFTLPFPKLKLSRESLLIIFLAVNRNDHRSRSVSRPVTHLFKKKKKLLFWNFLIDTTLKPINATGTVSANYYYETKENESLPNYLYCLALKKKKKRIRRPNSLSYYFWPSHVITYK